MRRFGVVILGTALCKIDWFHLFDCVGGSRRENDKPIDGAHTPKNSVKTCRAIVRLDCADLCRSNSMCHPTGNRINRKSIRLTTLYFWRFNRNMTYTQRPSLSDIWVRIRVCFWSCVFQSDRTSLSTPLSFLYIRAWTRITWRRLVSINFHPPTRYYFFTPTPGNNRERTGDLLFAVLDGFHYTRKRVVCWLQRVHFFSIASANF